MSRKPNKNGSRAKRKETRRKSLEALHRPPPPQPSPPSTTPLQPSTPLATAGLASRDSVKKKSSRPSLRRLLPTVCGFLALLTGISIKRSHHESAPVSHVETQGSSSNNHRLQDPDAAPQAPLPLADWLASTLADFRVGTLSAFRFRKLLIERIRESTVEEIRAFILSPPFSTAPDTVRSLTLQRLSEAPATVVRTLFATTTAPSLSQLEVHTLFGTQAGADPADFALWLNSLSPQLQLSLAHELAASVVADPGRLAAIVGTLTHDSAQCVIQHALNLLKPLPAKLIAFAAELPPSLAPQALMQGLQMSLTLPHVAKAFSLAQYPRATSVIHASILSRESASPYRALLGTGGVAESLPQGVARSLGLEFLFQRIAATHLESALLRLSKLANPHDREYATLGVIQGCTGTQPLRALDLAVTLPPDSPRRHEALLLAAYAAKNVDSSLTQRWLSSAPLNPDERALLTGDPP